MLSKEECKKATTKWKETNTKNWSHPSPPYANKSFSIFN